jgi:hypothetical protein
LFLYFRTHSKDGLEFSLHFFSFIMHFDFYKDIYLNGNVSEPCI